MGANNQMLDKFFNLGNKATQGDPVRKAYFDYCLYWVVFCTFIFLSLNYLYKFYQTLAFSYLAWGIVIMIFSWFNYWALLSFRGAYLNMKKFYSKPKETLIENETQDLFKD